MKKKPEKRRLGVRTSVAGAGQHSVDVYDDTPCSPDRFNTIITVTPEQILAMCDELKRLKQTVADLTLENEELDIALERKGSE